jgi:hypothetical protein
MDARHAEHLQPGERVAVYIGPHDLTGALPIVTTATVAALDPEGGSHFLGDGVWLEVDIAQGMTLPQRYRVEEVIGFLLPLAHIEHHADGSTTGSFPEGTVGP